MLNYLHKILLFIILLTSVSFISDPAEPSEKEVNTKESAGMPMEELVHFMHPKRELRAAWVTTFTNLDWPSKKGLSVESQKEEFKTLINSFQRNSINAVIVQVRASGDAFYKSELAPWSEWLTGVQGRAPENDFDPLKFMIEEAHGKNMEFHAWLNPYRAISHTRFSSVSPTNIAKTNPDWVFQYGNTVYFNPGIPAVRKHISAVVLEIIENYDVDGIHFDDYFYPYTIEGESIPDQKAFELYNPDSLSLDDWRRNNVNLLVKEVSHLIKTTKPHVKFGISPLAIWRNKKQDVLGSSTNSGQTSFDNLYCDTKLWLEEDWVDYLAPQLYWSTTNPYANYQHLIDWWTDNEFEHHLYIGHAIYKLDETARHSFGPDELIKQVGINRSKTNINGSIYFRAKPFVKNHQNFQETLSKSIYKYPSLVPTMNWIDSVPPLAPEKLKLKNKKEGVYVRWKSPEYTTPMDSAAYYIVYRFIGEFEGNQTLSSQILSIQKGTELIDTTAVHGETYTYLVTAVDRLHNESTDCTSEVIKRH